MYLDRTFVQRIGSAKVKSKCEVTNCAGYKLRATLLAHSLVVCVFYAVVCILCCGSTCRDILKENGSSVDAAIAALFCLGVHDVHSAGIGGGLFMLIYDT